MKNWLGNPRVWVVAGAFAAIAITAIEMAQFWFHIGWVAWLWLAIFPTGIVLMVVGLNRQRQGRGTRFGAGIAAVGILLVIAVPFVLVLVLGGLMSQQDLLGGAPRLLPTKPTLHWYRLLWERDYFLTAIRNSVIVATTSAVFLTLAGILGAYAIARIRFPGRSVVHNSVMFAYMLPGIALLVPLVFVFRRLGLIDTLQGMVLGHSVLLLPLIVWLLIGAFEAVEPDLEHAPRVDGASRWRALRLVIVPVTMPTVATVAVFAFVLSWNELLFSRVLAVSQIQMLSTEILKLMDPLVRIEPMLAAAGLISSIPVILLALLMQRYIIREIGEGSVK